VGGVDRRRREQAGQRVQRHERTRVNGSGVAFRVTLEYNNYVSPRQWFSGFVCPGYALCRQRSARPSKGEPLMLSLAGRPYAGLCRSRGVTMKLRNAFAASRVGRCAVCQESQPHGRRHCKYIMHKGCGRGQSKPALTPRMRRFMAKLSVENACWNGKRTRTLMDIANLRVRRTVRSPIRLPDFNGDLCAGLRFVTPAITQMRQPHLCREPATISAAQRRGARIP
jgi:hypothetical protein